MSLDIYKEHNIGNINAKRNFITYKWFAVKIAMLCYLIFTRRFNFKILIYLLSFTVKFAFNICLFFLSNSTVFKKLIIKNKDDNYR